MVIEYGKEIVEPPTYLTQSFLEEVIENAVRQANIKILHAKFTMGSCTGENYCSQIYRIKFQYTTADESDKVQELSVIVKSMPKTFGSEFLTDLKVFLKEKITYMEVLPRLNMLLKENKKFNPRLYHSLKTPINTLVFEDLRNCGFRMASRESGLDEKHCRLVLQRLGEFHALSIILNEKEPNMLKIYNEGLLGKTALDRDDSLLLKYFGGNANALIDIVSKWQGYENITKKLENYAANLKENLCLAQTPIADEFKVLNHGDLWVNNLFFKYDDKENLQDVIFLDFQMSVWGSPGIDLNYFLNTSLQFDVLKHKREVLIIVYYNSLYATLRRFDYENIPSFEQIREEVQRREPYGFFCKLCHISNNLHGQRIIT